MKAYVSPPPGFSRAMTRVAQALASYAPIKIVNEEHEADLVVLHVIGYPETVAAVASLKARGKKYAIIQYCLRSTQAPNTGAWLPIWSDEACLCVWSYYDLIALVREDFGTGDTGDANVACFLEKFYHAPMGVSSRTFRRNPNSAKRYVAFTSGYVPTTKTDDPGGEAILEVQDAVREVGGRMFHLGPGFLEFDTNIVTQEEGISDEYLVDLLNSTQYVTGLRRKEGFEMPALEGLLCGARPVCFDRPHYRYWFQEHAEYVPEGSFQEVAKALTEVFRGKYRPVTEEERQVIVARFDWSTVAMGFWSMTLPPAAIQAEERRKRVLWVGDAVVSSGFARATHKICDRLARDYDLAVLGINYFGDPHDYPYKIYPSLNPLSEEADLFGVKRIADVARMHQADVVIIQQDPWNFPAYIKELRNAAIDVPVIGFVAVDGKNCQGAALNDLALGIFWTEFGLTEARAGGFTKPGAIVPLGVDTKVYRPLDRVEARTIMELPKSMHNAFIVGNVNRNQPRKRLDLTVRYFCEWVKRYDVRDAFLFLHVAPTGDVGWDVQQLMQYYLPGRKRLILARPDVGHGIEESMLCATYNCFDVQVNTAAGEGMGLTTLEGMACGVPQIVPDWAALGEWPSGAARLIRCTSFTHTERGINVLGGVPDEEEFITALQRYYENEGVRQRAGQAALARANEPMFRWENIAEKFASALAQGLELLKQEVVSA